MSVSKMNGNFWKWAVIEKDGVIIVETKWVVCRNGKLINSRGNYASDYKNELGYIQNKLTHNGESYMMLRHRLVALAFVKNPRPDLFNCVDHIDRNPMNNRADNLRWVSTQLNSLNTKSKHISPLTRYKLTPYQARCRFMTKRIFIGYYATEAEAMNVQDRTRKSLFEALYFYRTQRNDFLPPEQWLLTPGCVRVMPKV
jgi:hypothetical protein